MLLMLMQMQKKQITLSINKYLTLNSFQMIAKRFFFVFKTYAQQSIFKQCKYEMYATFDNFQYDKMM